MTPLLPIIPVDTHYIHAEKTAIYLIPLPSGKIVIIDANTSHAIRYIQQAFENSQLRLDHVSHIILTHIHLDHAAGIHDLLKLCPNAQVIAHPKAVRHLVDPERLIAATKEIYGERQFQVLFGRVQAIAAGRIQPVNDREMLQIDNRNEFLFLHTEGHARHHICIYMPETGILFAGDNFGVCYPTLQKLGQQTKLADKENGNGIIFPSAPPAEFDAEKAKKSIQTIMDLQPDHLFIAHFGKIKNPSHAANILKAGLDEYQRIVVETFSAYTTSRNGGITAALQQQQQGKIMAALKNHLRQLAAAESVQWSQEHEELLQADLQLNSAGILAAAARMHSMHSMHSMRDTTISTSADQANQKQKNSQKLVE